MPRVRLNANIFKTLIMMKKFKKNARCNIKVGNDANLNKIASIVVGNG